MHIEPSLPSLIHSDQTGFIKGRYIGQNIRLLDDLMNFTYVNNIPGILLFIDFEKAFDTLEWISFLHRALKVMNGGYMTNCCKVSRGVRQGCPLSPFFICTCSFWH